MRTEAEQLEIRAPGRPPLRPGGRLRLGSHTVTRDEIVAFARRWDPLPMHTAPEGGVIASGAHTFSILVRLLSDAFHARYPVRIGRDVRHMAMRSPVRPGATLSGWFILEELQCRSGDDGLAVFRVILSDQDGREVANLVAEALVPVDTVES